MDVATVSDDEPKVAVEEIPRNKEVGSSRWLFGWRILNLTDQPMRFLSARCPHGQFRSAERSFEPPLHASAHMNATIEMTVLCDEPPGTIVENAFLILAMEWRQDRWRIFVRLRVTVDREGIPGTMPELITTQRVGFSGID
jgi:hypothetical protein